MLAGQRVLVVGDAGRALAGSGALVTVAGAGPVEVPPELDLVVVGPETPPASPWVVAAERAGVEVVGDVELAWRLAENPVWLAVAGTNGKTTTAGMLAAILRAAGVDAVACGNAGLPVIDAVLAGHEVLAVELSGFQPYWQSSLLPKASVVLNVAEDPLGRHGSLDGYAADQGRIYAGAGRAVFNADDVWSTLLAAGHPHALGFTLDEPGDHRFGIVDGWLVDGVERLAEVAEINAPGLHNVANALAAAALARVHGVPAAAVAEGLRTFRPGAHHADVVGEWENIRYVDDSKATNPQAAASSLGAYASVVWIAGGQLNGAPIDDLVAEAAPRLRGAVLIGTDREVLAAALLRHAPQIPTYQVGPGDDDPMTAAVRAARGMARPGDVVLLAPAAAPLDLFPDYAARGEAFAAAVKRLHGAA